MVPCLTTHLIASLSFRGHLALPPRAGGRDFRASLGAGLSSGGCRVNGLGQSWFARWAGQALLTTVRGALAPGHLGLFSQGCTWLQGPRRPDLKFVTLLPQCSAHRERNEEKARAAPQVPFGVTRSGSYRAAPRALRCVSGSQRSKVSG